MKCQPKKGGTVGFFDWRKLETMADSKDGYLDEAPDAGKSQNQNGEPGVRSGELEKAYG